MPDPVRLTLHLVEPASESVEAGAGAVRVAGDAGSELLVLETGQTIRGTVRAEVLEDIEFRQAQVRFVWHTEGRGNATTGEGGTVVLDRSGVWSAGATHEFSFETTVPHGPLSYQGRILSILWHLEAHLDRSMLWPDVVAHVPFRLSGRPDPEMASLGPVPQQRTQLEAAKRGMVRSWVRLGIVLLLAGIVYGAGSGWELGTVGRWAVFLLMSSGLLLTFKGLWGRLGRGKLGEPTVQLSTTELRLGEEIRFGVAVQPEQRTELRSLEAILECEERVVQGFGQYQTHHRRTVYEKRLSLAKDLQVEPHRGLRKKGTLTLPLDQPPSFGAPHNQIVWWLRFQGDIVGWPDWKEPILLTVWP